MGRALAFGKFSSTRGAWTQRPEAEPGVVGCLGELCCSPSFPLLTPTHGREPVRQGGETLPLESGGGTGRSSDRAQGRGLLRINPASGERARMGLNMLRPSLEGAPDLPEGPGQEEDEEVVSAVLP